MSEKQQHMRLWERVCVTDPKAVKPITGKQYSGNSPKPYWIVQRLTEEFGPCGLGWGYTVLNERMERLSPTDVLHVAVVRFWYELDGKRGEVEQIGQTKATYMSSKDKLVVDEDAPKKSVTDALVKCASYIGFAGDIFSGRWDDSKYVAWAREHYAEDAPEPEQKTTSPIPASFRSTATDGPIDVAEERQTIISLAASVAAEKFKRGGKDEAFDVIAEYLKDNEEMLYLQQQLKAHSTFRAYIKFRQEQAAKRAATQEEETT
jgi:hypothetical protein